jgi:hypothetical protein
VFASSGAVGLEVGVGQPMDTIRLPLANVISLRQGVL